MLLGRNRSPLQIIFVYFSTSALSRRLVKFREGKPPRLAGILLIAVTLLCARAGGAQYDSARLPKSLEPLARVYPPAVLGALRAFKLGVEEYLEGNYAASAAALPDDAAAGNTALRDCVLLYRARAALKLDRADEALKLYRLLQTRYSESSLYAEAVLGECQSQLKLHDPAAALVTLRNPRLHQGADAAFYQGRALEDSGRRREAMEIFLRIYCNYVNSGFADEARERLLVISPRALSGTQSYQALLVRADNLLHAGRYHEARALLVRLGKIAPPDKQSSQKRIVLFADAEYRLGKASAVLPYLRKITTADPAIHARAIYLEGACYRRLKREESFLQMRDKALKLYPDSTHTEQLLVAVASQFDVSNEVGKAQEAYRILYEKFPRGEYAERALWRMSLFSYVQKQYDEALLGFYRYLKVYREPASAIPAIYWMARCYQSLGDITHASLLLQRVDGLAQHSYYSRRASEAEQALKRAGTGQDRPFSGLAFADVAATVEAIRLPLATMAEPSEGAARIIERARQLLAADLPDLALSELRGGIRIYPAERALRYVMSRIFEIEDDYYGVIATLRQAFPDYNDRPADSLPEEIWQLLFPVKHWTVISLQASKYQVDPNLVLGIIRQESAFKEGARSAANARGLMQVLPSTGRVVARQAGVTRYTVKKLYSAETNIVLGLHHFSSLLQQYGNSEELALAAYNAGSDRADLWSREFGLTDMAEFVDRIPFSETRNYIKQVITNQAHYALLTPSLATAER